MKQFNHPAIQLQQKKPLVFTALSKHLFYFRMFISKHVLENGAIPVNPFMAFDYFLLDSVDRNLVREGNNNLLMRCDELWVFGSISNGVLVEIQIAQSLAMPIKYFKVVDTKMIVEVAHDTAEWEEEVKMYKSENITPHLL